MMNVSLYRPREKEGIISKWEPWVRNVFSGVEEGCRPGHDRIRENRLEEWMGTLLANCYARGIFRSVEIELAAANDQDLREICADHIPNAQEIMRFRRKNMDQLRQALMLLFSPEETEERLIRAIRLDSADLDE